MIKSIEIRQTYRDMGLHVDTLRRYTANDIRILISGEEAVVFVDGNVVEDKNGKD